MGLLRGKTMAKSLFGACDDLDVSSSPRVCLRRARLETGQTQE